MCKEGKNCKVVSLATNVFRYEIVLLTFSILFAEAFPSGWKGKSRIFLSTIWITGSMFIIFIYLCNLRSHLIRGIQEIPPGSIEEFIQDKFSQKLHYFPRLRAAPDFKQLAMQGRYVSVGKYQLQIFFSYCILC